MTDREIWSTMLPRVWARAERKESVGVGCVEADCAFADAAGGLIVPGAVRVGARRGAA